MAVYRARLAADWSSKAKWDCVTGDAQVAVAWLRAHANTRRTKILASRSQSCYRLLSSEPRTSTIQTLEFAAVSKAAFRSTALTVNTKC